MTHIDTLDASTSIKSVPTPARHHRLVMAVGAYGRPTSMQLWTAVVAAVREAASSEEGRPRHAAHCAARRHHQARPSVRYSRVQAAQCHAGHRALGTHMAVPLRRAKVPILRRRRCRRCLPSKSCAQGGVTSSGLKPVMVRSVRGHTCNPFKFDGDTIGCEKPACLKAGPGADLLPSTIQ